MQRHEEQALNDYCNKQSELQEVAFQKQLQEAFEKAKKEPHHKVIYFEELAKYQLMTDKYNF